MFRATLVGAIMIAAISTSYAEPTPAQQLAAGNFIDDSLECAAYFLNAASAFETRDEGKLTAVSYKEMAHIMVTSALTLAPAAGIKLEAVTAKLSLFSEDQRTAIDASAANISILFQRHSKMCKALLDEPEERMKALLAEASK